MMFLILFLLCAGNKQVSSQEDLLGSNVSSEKVQKYFSELGVEPKYVNLNDNDGYYYVYKTKGIEFKISNSGIVELIWIFSEGSDGYRQFKGTIPHKLSFTDNRKVVEKKLGKPDVTLGCDLMECESFWKNKKLAVQYKTMDSTDMLSSIKQITLGIVLSEKNE